MKREDKTNIDFISLYNDIYNLENKEKLSVVIPSYNINFKRNTISLINKSPFKDRFNIYIVVRESQKEMYESYISESEYVNCFILSFHDEDICNTGLVRKKIVECYIEDRNIFGSDRIFMFDDDLFKIGFTGIRDADPYVVMKIWKDILYSVEFGVSSCKNAQDQNMNDKMSRDDIFIEDLLRINSSLGYAFSYLDLLQFKKCNINYRDSDHFGHEDIDIIVNFNRKSVPFIKVNFIFSHMNSYDKSRWNNEERKERRERQNELMRNSDNFDYYIIRNEVSINWKKLNEDFFNGEYININDIRKMTCMKILISYEKYIRRQNNENI